VFNTAVQGHELVDVENECTSYHFRLFAIFMPKIVRVGGNLTKLMTKIILLSSLRDGV